MGDKMASDHHHEVRLLIKAASTGDVNTLNRLIGKSPHLFSSFLRQTHGTTPLHVSALHGHLAFTKSLLSHCPGMANEPDSFGRTPLHLASAEGHEEVVKALLSHANPHGDSLDRCGLCLARDKDKRIPLHWAVMKGRVPVIRELEKACPKSLNELLEGDTVLHLAIKFYQLPALKELVDLVRKNGNIGLLSEGNQEGNSILHLAVLLQQKETVEYLVSLPEIQATATETLNNEGFNALEALERKEDQDPMELKAILKKDKRVRSRWDQDQPAPPQQPWFQKTLPLIKDFLKMLTKDQVKWISEARGQLIVVATIITTITFQIAVNPPGGIYQASFTDLNNPDTMNNVTANKHCQGSSRYHKKCQIPGNAVLGYSNPVEFGVLTLFNTAAFTGSLCITFILASGFPLIDPVVLTAFNLAVAATLESLMVTFLLSLDLTNPMLRRTVLGKLSMASSGVDFSIFNIIVGVHLIVLAWWIFKIPRYSQLAEPIKQFIARFPLLKQNGTSRPNVTPV